MSDNKLYCGICGREIDDYKGDRVYILDNLQDNPIAVMHKDHIKFERGKVKPSIKTPLTVFCGNHQLTIPVSREEYERVILDYPLNPYTFRQCVCDYLKTIRDYGVKTSEGVKA